MARRKSTSQVSKPIIIKMETGKCKAEGCAGVVGRLQPMGLIDQFALDGAPAQVLLAFPCDKCGALHGTPRAEEIIEDRQGNQVFFQKKQLVYKNNQGRTVRMDKSRIRG